MLGGGGGGGSRAQARINTKTYAKAHHRAHKCRFIVFMVFVVVFGGILVRAFRFAFGGQVVLCFVRVFGREAKEVWR